MPKQAVLLTVVKTSPASGSTGNPVNTSIALDFNLPVDPVAVNGSLGVVASGSQNPLVAGTLAAGTTPEKVVFTPAASFHTGTTVDVTLLAGLNSLDGSALGSDFTFSFATVPDPRTVGFLVSGVERVRLVNAQSGHPVTMSIQSGVEVPSGVALKTYRASVQDLLTAFVYSSNGYLENPVNTAALQPVDSSGTTMTASGARTNMVQDSVQVTVLEPDGIYVIVAADSRTQYGVVWIDFSHYAILLRQDDQRVVLAGEDLDTGTMTARFDVTFYNLLDGVHTKASGTLSGAAEYPAAWPSGFDLAVAQAGGETVVVPMAMPETNADERVFANQSAQLKIFLTTDRLAYQKGDTIRFAGVVRLNNDQAYTLGSGLKVAITSDAGDVLAVADVAANGTFSGSFAAPPAAFNADGTDASLTLFVAAASGTPNPILGRASTTVVASGTHAPSGSLTVTLDKRSYSSSDTIVASIAGVGAGSQPLAGETVAVIAYGSQHVVQPIELDSFPSTTSWGEALTKPLPVQLDATGHGTFSLPANFAQKATDLEITISAAYGSGAAQIVGAKTAIVYQAADEVFWLSGRLESEPGETVTAQFVVESRDGTRVPGAAMSYEIDSTDYSGDKAITTVVANGTATTDSNGLGTVRAAISTNSSPLDVLIKGRDSAGNIFQDTEQLYFNLPYSSSSTSDSNPSFDVTVDKIAYSTGESAQLTVTSHAAGPVLLSLERGRVHHYRVVQLAKGDNHLTIPVTPDLAPGFNVVFSYIQAGFYTNQAYPIHVSNTSRLLNLTLKADQASYSKGQTAHVTLTVVDASGTAVAGTALADGYEARMSGYKLVDQPSIAGAFLTPDPLTTNESSSLVPVGSYFGLCGGGPPGQTTPDPTPTGQAFLWSPNLTIDASGHATISVPLQAVPVRLVVFAATASSAWGQAEIDLNVQ